MKKKVMLVLLIVVCMMSGCNMSTCKVSDCDETKYEDGYCKTHYYMNVGDTVLKEVFN